MKENRFDIVTDMVKERFRLASKEAQKMFKNTNPYRQEKMSDDEILQKYLSLDPQVAQALQNSMPDFWIQYENRMKELLLRR